jgi:putative copper resistance protein D
MGLLASWPVDPLISLSLLGAGVVYVRIDRRVALRHGGVSRPWPRRWFVAGLLTVFAALQSPIDAGAETSLSIHMVQHLLLTMVAAPLLVLGAPVRLALQASSGTTRRRLLAIIKSRPAQVLGNPLVAWSLFFGFLWGSHVTALYETTLRNGWIHAAEHLVYLASAVLFWMPVIGRDPGPTRISFPARILYLFLAMPAMAFLGLAIFSGSHVLYPAYANVEGTARALADQRMAGALMWSGTMFLIVPALALVLLDWMRADEREARRIDERLARGSVSVGPGPG